MSENAIPKNDYKAYPDLESQDMEPKQNQSNDTNKSSNSDEPGEFKLNVSTTVLLVWRIIGCVSVFAIWVIAIYQFEERIFEYTSKFLTYWGLVVTTAYCLAAAIVQPEKTNRIKALSILFTLIFSLNLVITIIYWVALFPTEEFSSKFGQAMGMLRHIVPIVVTTVDFVINRYKIYPIHSIIIAAIVYVVYIIVNVAFTFGQDDPVYSIITYKALQGYLYLIGALVIIGIGILIVWGFTKLKMKK